MASNGHMGEFNNQLEDWRSYTERLQNYFIANDIKSEAKQRAILLSVCGPRTDTHSFFTYRHKNPKM